MDDSGPEPPPERDTPKMKFITTAFVVIAIAVVVVVVGTKEYYTAVFDKEYHEKVEVPVSPLRTQLEKTEQDRLTKYQWVDEKKGIVRIPVDKAKELVVANYKARPINTEAPAPPPPPKPAEPPPPPPRPEKELPGGARIHFDPNSTQEQLVKFIEDKDAKVDKETWFNFDKVTFETGKSTPSPESKEQLDDIAAILTAYPDLELKIGGYTDNTGDAATNKKISGERAEAVVKALVERGIKKERLKSEGYGPEHPVAPNDTPENKEKNRRLAVRVTKKPKLEDPAKPDEKKDPAKPDEKKDPGQAPNPTPQPNPKPNPQPQPQPPTMQPQPKPQPQPQPPKPAQPDSPYPAGI